VHEIAGIADGIPFSNMQAVSEMTGRSTLNKLRVCYPPGTGKLVLRTELDWDKDVYPVEINDDGTTSTFEIETSKPYLHFKPCLIKKGSLNWAVGTNKLLITGQSDTRVVYPYFFSDPHGRFLPLLEVESAILDSHHRLRVYLPPGYEENTLAHYPFAYMQDGQNLFFPTEAFQHKDWGVKETSQVLRAMEAIEEFIIVGVYSDKDRQERYTKPGYEAYARSIVEELVPAERLFLRTTNERGNRSMWGSSLGGVVSFYTVWQYPEVFGGAICMSSTFSYKDDLIERVLSEPYREVKFYLDSGWPGDNYEATLAMAQTLVHRGWRFGRDLLYLSFPNAAHDEKAWGMRLHLPMQLFTGIVARASRQMPNKDAGPS
jgi:Predicted hydrolase of the alpha/beta superfamily